MNNNTFNSIKDFVEYRQNLKLSSDLVFTEYLNEIYSNLLLRVDTINHSNAITSRKSQDLKIYGSILSYRKNSVSKKNLQKAKKIDKGICLQSFLEYINYQDLIGERIFKYLNKSKQVKLNNIDFTTGLNKIYYGDIKDLIQFTFFLGDFNDDGKIYKSDMKLILVYIPSSSEYHQKLKIRKINKIINKFFEEKIGNPQEGSEKEINFDDYSKYIMEYEEKNKNIKDADLLNDYNNNAPFYFFISIISYIFQNCPFNVKSVNYFSQKKIKLKIMRNDNNLKNPFLTTAKKNEVNNNIDTITKFELSSNGLTSVKLDINKFQKLPLSKIDKKNLFNSKRSLSQRDIVDGRENEKYLNLIKSKQKSISKNKETIFSKSNKKLNLFKKNESNLFKHELRKNKKIVSFPDLSFKSTLLSSRGNDYSYSPVLGLNKNSSNEDSSTNSNTNLAMVKYNSSKVKLPLISKEKLSPLSVGVKLKEDVEEPDDDFVLCVDDKDDNDIVNGNIIKNAESNLDNQNSNETYLYKLCEDMNGEKTIMNKFYAKLCEKEILFFSPDLKREFCDLWYIYRSHISLGKEYLNNQKYYTINITFFNNNYVNKLFFVNESLCQSFANKIKNSIHDLNFRDFYELKKKVGQGHFGTVNECVKKSSGQIFAVKIINKNELKSSDLELISQEKNYLRLIMHPNIISLKDYYEDRKCIYLITELYKGGDLLTFIENYKKKNIRIPEKTTAKIIRKIAEGIKYLNIFGIVHRDIKPENILFSTENEIESLKIIDLGVCQTLTYGEMAKEPIGTNGYISPEIYLHNDYSYKTDIWSLGVILYLLITEGLLPFDNENMDYKVIGKKVLCLQQEYPDAYFRDKNPGLIKLLDEMLEKCPQKRININDLMKHSWFNILKNK